MAEKASSTARGWVTVIAGLGINLALGVLYTWSVLTATLTKQFNWTALDALIPYAIALLVFGVMMAFAGRIQDKIGPGITATVGGVLVGIGMVMSSFNDMAAKANHLPIIVGFGVLTGAGIGLGYASATPAAVKWFHPSKKGLVTGLVVAGFGLASVYAAPLTTKLIESYGVPGMFRILGIAFFVAIVVLAQLLKNPPAGYIPPVPAKANSATAAHAAVPANVKRDYTWREMVRTPQFYLLWIMFACVSFAGLMMIGIISKVAVDLFGTPGKPTFQEVFLAPSIFGLSRAYWFTVALALGNGLGRPAAGIVSDAIGRTRTMIVVFLLQAAFVGWAVGATTNMSVLLLVGFAIGAMYGSNLTLFPATTFDFFGMKNGGVNYGLVFTAWGVGGALGSYFAGFAKNLWGSFGPAYTMAAVLCVLAAALTVLTKAPRAQVSERTPATEVGEPA